MKIGIYGGSFNPIHKGHLYVANIALTQYHLDQIILMPSHHSPNKADTTLADPMHRLAMCKLMAKENDKIIVDDYEALLPSISYTYLTIEHYKTLYPDDDLYFIMGADSLDYLDTWVHPEIICKNATILVLEREGFSREDMQVKINELSSKFVCNIRLLEGSRYDASSTDIRQSLLMAPNQCPDDLSLEVFEYLKENHIYGL